MRKRRSPAGRIFAQRAGTSPERFFSYLPEKRTNGSRMGHSGMRNVSCGARHSGLGKIYEAVVAQNTASSDECKSGAVEIRYGIAHSPFGWCLIGLTKRGVSDLSFLDSEDEAEALKILKKTRPRAILVRDDARALPYIKKIFGFSKKERRIPIVLRGTNFQIEVWKALLAIPPGNLATYSDIARRIGSPKAARAVGTACGKNPLGFLVPCHRVLASSGALGGYRWGLERKEMLLAWESARRYTQKKSGFPLT